MTKPYRNSRAPKCATHALLELARLADASEILLADTAPVLHLVGPGRCVQQVAAGTAAGTGLVVVPSPPRRELTTFLASF